MRTRLLGWLLAWGILSWCFPLNVSASEGASVNGMLWRTSRFQTVTLSRGEDHGCGKELKLTVWSEKSELQLSTNSAVLSSNDAHIVKGLMQLTCSQPSSVRFQFSPTGEWSLPWAVVVSAPHEGRVLTRSPLSPDGSVVALDQGENTLEFQVFFPVSGTLELYDWEVLSPPSLAEWYEELSGSSAQAWTNAPYNDVLSWALTAGTPTLAQLLPLPGCSSFGEVFLPAAFRTDCEVRDQPVFYSLPQGKRWVQRESAVYPLQGTALQKPSEPGDITISEVSWAGSFYGDTHVATDQWLEVFNPTQTTWNLSGVRFTSLGIFSEELRVSSTVVIPPGGYVIVGRLSASETRLDRQADIKFSNLRVPKTLLGVKLLSSQGEVLDQLPDGEWQAGILDSEQKITKTAQRVHPSLPGNQWSSWQHCDSLLEEKCMGENTREWKQKNTQNIGTPWNPSLL